MEKAGNAEEINRLFSKWREGDKQAFDELFGLLYEELQAIAHRQFRRERGNHTLQTDDLVSKLYLKLLGSKTIPWKDYGFFLKSAARTMRQILIDHARGWQRRTDGQGRVSLDEMAVNREPPAAGMGEKALLQLVALHEAIEKMEAIDPVMARVTDLKLTLGFSLEEVANKLGLSLTGAKREWLIAKKFLGKAV